MTAEPVAFRAVPWRPRHAAAALAPLLALHVTARVLPPHALDPFARLGLLGGVQVWALGYAVWVARRHGWRPREAWSAGRTVREAVVAALVLVGVWAALLFGYRAWCAAFGEPPPGPDWAARATGGGPVALAVLAAVGVLLAPAAEEVLFRGVLFGALGRVLPAPVAVAGQAAAFGAVHLSYGPAHAVQAAVAGAVLAGVAAGRRSLATPILCHTFHNAASFALLAVWLAGSGG